MYIAIHFPPAKRKKKFSCCVFSIQWQPDRLHVGKPGRSSGSGGNSHCVGLRSGGKAEDKQKTGGKTKEILFGKPLPITGSEITARHRAQENVKIFSMKSALGELLSVVIYPKLAIACHLKELTN